MMRYIKKPVAIEAIVLNPANIFKVTAFIDGKKPDISSNMASDKWEGYKALTKERGYIIIETLEGNMHASFGDYIIKGIKGEFYPCKPDIFKLTYFTEQEYAEALGG
jgi:hypothetical protein